jgi:hypothetical protein
VASGTAELTNPLPAGAGYGPKGSVLPDYAGTTAHVSLRRDVSLGSDLDAYLSVAASRVGDRKGPFGPTAVRVDDPAYVKVDLQAGLRTGPWSVVGYVTNVGDERGVTQANTFTGNTIYIPPRTFGVTLRRDF